MSLLDLAIRRTGGVGVETVMAALAALATAAAVFLMPVGVLQEAVAASGMADALPALQPPLGWKARLGLALLAAGSAFGTALLLMRLLGRLTAPRPARDEDADGPVVPRVRRRDRHPDAPVRPPLSVSRDLGEPDDEHEEPAAESVRAVRRPVERDEPVPAPVIRRAAPDAAPRSPLPWLNKEEEAPALPRLSRIERAAAPEPEPIVAEEPAAPEQPQTALAKEPEEVPSHEPEPVAEQAAPEPEPQPELEPAMVEEPETAVTASPVASNQPAWLQPAAPEGRRAGEAEESIGALLARFERAMERRAERSRRAEPQAPAAEADEGTDLRLRSALESLKRFAPRQG